MAEKLLALACVRNESRRSSGGGGGGGLSPPRPHYPSMPKYPRGGTAARERRDVEQIMAAAEAKALFAVTGMTCAACAGSVEKAVKRLPGIREAVVDVLNGRAQVHFYPDFVNVSHFFDHHEQDKKKNGNFCFELW